MKTRHFSKEESNSNFRSTNAKLRSINYQKKIVLSFALLSLISGFLGFANVAQAACTTTELTCHEYYLPRWNYSSEAALLTLYYTTGAADTNVQPYIRQAALNWIKTQTPVYLVETTDFRKAQINFYSYDGTETDTEGLTISYCKDPSGTLVKCSSAYSQFYEGYKYEKAEIFLNRKIGVKDVEKIVGHEIGHALGLDHSADLDSPSIMYPYTQQYIGGIRMDSVTPTVYDMTNINEMYPSTKYPANNHP